MYTRRARVCVCVYTHGRRQIRHMVRASRPAPCIYYRFTRDRCDESRRGCRKRTRPRVPVNRHAPGTRYDITIYGRRTRTTQVPRTCCRRFGVPGPNWGPLKSPRPSTVPEYCWRTISFRAGHPRTILDFSVPFHNTRIYTRSARSRPPLIGPRIENIPFVPTSVGICRPTAITPDRFSRNVLRRRPIIFCR